MEQQYGFEIDETAIVKEIHENGIITYTLGIKTDDLHSNQLRNLLVEQSVNNEVNAYILTYNLTSPLLAAGHNSFQLNYSTATIEAINYNDNQTSRVLLSNGCYMSNVLMCSEPWVGQTFGSIHVAGHDCFNPAYLSMQSVIDCPNESGGGGETPIDNGGSIGGGGSPTSPTAPSLTEVEDVDGPCSKLKQVSLAMKTKLTTIKNDASTATCEKCEFGYQMEYNATSSQITTGPLIESGSNFIATDYTLTSIGLIHSHSMGLHQMFSFSDVLSLYYLNKFTNPANIPLGVIYLVSPTGTTYAIKVDNPTSFKSWMENKYKNTQGKDATERIGRLNDALANQHPPLTPFGPSINEREKTEEDFIKFFEGANLSIYSTTDLNYQNWNKLTLSNNNQSRITPIPCN